MATQYYAGTPVRSTPVVAPARNPGFCSRPEPRAFARAGLGCLLLALWLGACGGPIALVERPVAPVTLDWVAKAEAQESLRNHQRARLLYLRAKRESPDDHSRAHAAAKYAGTLMHWGELDAARHELQEATQLAPRNPGYWHNLGHVEHHLGHDPSAENALRRSISLAPKDPRSHLSLAALLWRQKRFDEALSTYKTLLKLEIPEGVRASIREKALPRLRAAKKRAAPPAEQRRSPPERGVPRDPGLPRERVVPPRASPGS